MVKSADAMYHAPSMIEGMQCANCQYFLEDNQPCEVIVDPISSKGMCLLHTKREQSDVEKDLLG